MFELFDGEEYRIIVFGVENEIDAEDDNVDVEVQFKDGRRYGADFFTLRNVQSLFAKNKLTGECGGGLYLWSSDMILVERLTGESIIETVRELIAAGEFQSAFQFFDPKDDWNLDDEKIQP